MASLNKFLDKTFFLFVILSALLMMFGSSYKSTYAVSEALSPVYVQKQMITKEEAYERVMRSCMDDDLSFLKLNLSPPPCVSTPQKITEKQQQDLWWDRHQYEQNTVRHNSETISKTAVVLGLLMLLISLLRLLYKLYIHLAQPAIRRATAPTRTRHMEQEFLQMKLLHENGVISDEEFSKKKEQLRARVMAE